MTQNVYDVRQEMISLAQATKKPLSISDNLPQLLAWQR